MEPGYNDPNYWMRWYAEQQELQRARQEADAEPPDQAGFEQQLGELQLRSAEESSSESSSPEAPALRSHENIDRPDIGGSMRMPPRSNLRDSSFSSTRYSVDVPHAHLGSAASDYQSDLRDRPFSSMRYTASSELQPEARTKESKSRGLFSRVKSGLGKVFGGSRREKSSGGSSSDAVYSELRMDFAKRSRPSEEDLELIEEFKTALGSANRKTKTIENYVTALRMFSEFLRPKGITLKDLLGNADRLAAYKDEFMKVASANSRNYVGGALETLRNFQAGNPIPAPAFVTTREQPMHPQDERMIRQFVENVKDYRITPDGTRGRGTGKVPAATLKSNVQALNTFARWLRAQNKGPLALRAFNEPRSLAADIDEYVEAGGDDRDRLSAALSHLRRIGADGLQAVGAGARLMGRETLSAHPEDISTIDDFLTDALSKLGSDATKKEKAAVSTMVSRLRSFSDWLQREGRPSIMDRIGGNPAQQSSLNADYAAFSKATKRTAPLDPFREYLGLEPQQGFRPYEDDARLIEGLANEELSKLDPGSQHRRKTIQGTASAQRKFSDWLRTEGRESIASRINGNNEQQRSLDADYRAYADAKGKSGVTLKKLRQYVQVVEANRALGVPSPQQRAGSDSTSIPTWMRDLPTPPSESEWPPIVARFGQAGLLEPAGSSSTWSPQLPTYFDFPTPNGEPARSSDIYRGLGSLVDLPSTPQDMRDDAQSGPVQSPAGRPPFFIGPSGVPQELEDIGYLVGEDWQHGSQPVPDFLLDVLDNKMLLPSSRMAPQPVSINGETYSITLGPRGRRDAQLIHHGGPSSAPKARVGGSAASAPAGDRSGRVLGARDWLGDEHIQRDYELLAQELWASNPNLAARTRFADPLTAFRVGQGTNAAALSAFHQIVDDPNGNDTADFLFLPVNDASTMDLDDRGSHWSLLLVDRRDRNNPVAYHYDSARGRNDRPAAMLAARVGAGDNLQNAPIRQQRNGYDCGVFVLDGTRALARRLAGRRQPDLNLSNLVVDRQALQNRLRD
ncbi:Ulp1 family isopeptidase [Bradyrhizobium sp. STM 3566]|uniref:Ulp1 family isopeptidase n=1 Tax=Bradyrhizobium sp. STM 3566 TaxID=578928 RepID=UPI00388F1A7B